MKAVTLNAADAPPVVSDDLDPPTPGDDEVLVRVQASSANPVDNAIAAGMLAGMVEHEFPIVLGRDYAGVVEQVGSAVRRFAVGDEVYGFLVHANPTVHDGTWAELITVPEASSIAKRPASVDTAAVAVAPLAGITALTAMDALQLSEGDTVLIVGATGGVGSFAVQLAADAGATVLAPALPEDGDYLRGLGVAEVLDREADVAAAARERYPDGVDALLDVVSYTPDALELYAKALKQGGRAASSNSAAGDAAGRANVMAVPSRENLERLALLLEAGTLKAQIQEIYELARAPEALQALGGSHTRGKIAIRVA